jgi:hypothetical protein
MTDDTIARGGPVEDFRDLMREAEYERSITESPEADVLTDAICSTMSAYIRFLDRHGLVWETEPRDNPDRIPRMRASALVVTADFGEHYGSYEIVLKNGAVDRVYGSGHNPDPYGAGPPDIPQA